MNSNKIFLIAILVALIGSFFLFDLGQYLDLSYLQSKRADLDAYVQTNPMLSAGLFLLVYIGVTGLSVPGAVPLTLLGGAVFGLWWGTVLVSFGSTIGATLAFLVSRYILRDSVRSRFSQFLTSIDKGIERDGAFYLFTLRLVPLFPFFAINLAMGLTKIKTLIFYLVSQLGMLPGTAVYVNAGTQLGQLESAAGLFSPALLGSFILLGLFPLVAKKALEYYKARKALSGFEKPTSFDQNLVVIGAGSGGLVSALIAAAVKSKVTLIEKGDMGGDCLNTGCVPSKALIRSARFMADTKRARELGFKSVNVEFDFADIMQRVQRVIKRIEPHDSVERFEGLGVNVIKGEATLVSPYEVEVNGQRISTRAVVIATGGGPFVPPIPGIDDVPTLTSDTIWALREQPRRLLVLGGGAIGCELAQCFARLGSDVTIVEGLPRILSREDEAVSELMSQRFREEGVAIHTGCMLSKFKNAHGQAMALCKCGEETLEIEFDACLVAVGRKANSAGLGLEALGIETNRNGTLVCNEYLQTRFPNVYACGDVVGPYQFTHTASHQAWYASVNALFSRFRKFRVDYSVIPWATFTSPEIARVGLNETDAQKQDIEYEITEYPMDDLDRAIADEDAIGFVKVLTEPGKDRILGVTIVGEHASDMLPEFVTAMRYKLGLNKILGTIHAYPTLSEANKFAAGNWKRTHKPDGLLKWVERYHRWQRGKQD